MRTQAVIDDYLVSAQNRQLAPKTIQGFSWALKKLATAFPENLPHDPDELVSFIGQLEMSPTSRHDVWRCLRTFWRWSSQRGLSEDLMVAVPAPRVRPTLPRTLSAKEIERLFICTKSQRDKALLAVPLDNGVRVGEMASMTWESVWERSMMVSGKVGERLIPISPTVRKLLTGLGDGKSVWIGRRGRMTASGIQLAIRRAFFRAGLGPTKAGPHALRHTFALRYIMNGGDVFSLQRILGHSNVQSTMIYVRMSADHLVQQHSKFSPLADYKFDVAI